MKGLLIKDLHYVLQNKKMLAVLLFVAVGLSFMHEDNDAVFVIAYMTMVCGMLVLNTISVDEYDKSIVFLMTMPIDRTIYTKEKYIFAFGCSMFGWLVSTMLCMVWKGGQTIEILMQAALIFVALSFFQMLILPVQLKFGGDKGRIALLGIVAFLVLLFLAAKEIGNSVLAGQAEAFVQEAANYLNSINRLVLGIAAGLLWIVCLAVSVTVSKRIMEKKEF